MSSSATVARSLLFNALFYVNITLRMIVALPTILLQIIFMALVTAFASRRTVNRTLQSID